MDARPTAMRCRITALLALAVLALAACGDGSDDTTTTGPSGDDPPPAGDDLDAEVIFLAEGVAPLDGPPAVQVLDPDDPEAAADLFVASERDAALAAVLGADLEGRTLLGGLVHEGCFSAGGVSVELVDGHVTFAAEDVDPQEGQVACARAVVTTALVSVPADRLPEEEGDDEVLAGQVVLLEPIAAYESGDVPGPGLVRDRVDLEALLGRYGLGEPDRALLDGIETGDEVLVAAVVGGSCTLPVEVAVRRTGDDLVLDQGYDPEDEDLVCDAVVQGLAVVAVPADAVEGVETVDGAPSDGPTGVGAIQAVEPVDLEAEPLAATLDDTDLATIPGAPAALDLPPVEGDAVRLVFVVEACEPDTAELVADLDAGTVRAEAQQSAARVECEALSPYLVIADLAADHADLTPTT